MPKVLIVDDSLSVRRALERVLNAKNFEVVTAQSGEEALERLTIIAPDLIVADIIMPGIGGFELCRKLRERDPQTPVILISGVGEAQVEQQAYAMGAAAVIPKPFSPEDLDAALEVALNSPAPALQVAEPQIDEAQAAEPRAIEPRADEPETAELQVAEPQTAEPQTAEPQVATPQIVESQTDESQIVEPQMVEPQVVEPRSAALSPALLVLLTRFLDKPEVLSATLSDRQGRSVAQVGERVTDAPTWASYSRFLLIASDVFGAHFGTEPTDGVVLEFPSYALYLGRVDDAHILGLHLSDAKALSVVRYLIRKTLPGLAAGLRPGTAVHPGAATEPD